MEALNTLNLQQTILLNMGSNNIVNEYLFPEMVNGVLLNSKSLVQYHVFYLYSNLLFYIKINIDVTYLDASCCNLLCICWLLNVISNIFNRELKFVVNLYLE